MFQRILVAVIQHRGAERALAVAVDLATRFDAQIVVAACDTPPVLPPLTDVAVPVDAVTIEGVEDARHILDYAHEHGFDMIVFARRGTGDDHRHLFHHELAEDLVEGADVPVLVVPEPAETPPAAEAE